MVRLIERNTVFYRIVGSKLFRNWWSRARGFSKTCYKTYGGIFSIYKIIQRHGLIRSERLDYGTVQSFECLLNSVRGIRFAKQIGQKMLVSCSTG